MSEDPIRRALSDHVALARQVADELSPQIQELVERVLDTLGGGGKLLFCGNGGSAADAQHLAAEFVVRCTVHREALAAVALTTDGSILTAGGNDLGFDHVFERQVHALARPGDLLMLHSTSGESENLVLAARAARAADAASVALLAKGGGRLRDEVDLALVVPTDSTARAQEMHITIGHIVCELVERVYAAGGSAREAVKSSGA
jgi:D-sedoheptulose 7-phosphate isomerase